MTHAYEKNILKWKFRTNIIMAHAQYGKNLCKWLETSYQKSGTAVEISSNVNFILSFKGGTNTTAINNRILGMTIHDVLTYRPREVDHLQEIVLMKVHRLIEPLTEGM